MENTKVNQKNGCEANQVNLFSVPFTMFPLKYFVCVPTSKNKEQRLHYAKFVGFFLLVWAPGLFVTYFTDSFTIYLSDWHYLVYSAMTTVFLFLLVDLCRQTASTLNEMKEITHHVNAKEFSGFVARANNSSFIWYGLCIMAPLVVSISSEIVNQLYSLHLPCARVVDLDYVSPEVARLNCPLSIYGGFLLSLVLGIGINRFIHYLVIINYYGNTFLRNASIDLLNPGSIDELKAFRRLVLKSALFCSLALTVSSLYFFEHFVHTQAISYFWAGTIIVIIFFFLYTVLSQMRWVRLAVSNAKKAALSTIDKKIRESRDSKDNVNTFVTLKNLFEFREKIKKTPTWTFDSEFVSTSFLAIVLPILGGASIQIILERIMSSFLP